MPVPENAKERVLEIAGEAGKLLLGYFGNIREVRNKGDVSNVVTEADVASEALIISDLKKHFPSDSILGEESGFIRGESPYTWVIDPLDGTSNFVAGIPWFGVLIALLEGAHPVLGVVYLPVSSELYWAEQGRGAFRNGMPIKVSDEAPLSEVLWCYGMDATREGDESEREVRALCRLKNSVRNVRATNSLVDACYTADGRVGGFLNQQMKVWDIAASAAVIEEAGGLVTDTFGRALSFDMEDPFRNYAVIACASTLHRPIISLLSES